MGRMILVSLLAVTTLITLSKASPLSYATYRKRGLADGSDQVYVPYLINGQEPSANDIYWPQMTDEETANLNNSGSTTTQERMKRIGSLSVMNSMDVLRQRVLLELARRKAMQDQMQVNANRRILDNIGKRSSQRIGIDYPRMMGTRNLQNFESQYLGNQAHSNFPTRSPLERTLDWFNLDNSGNQNNDNDQSSKMETNELRLL